MKMNKLNWAAMFGLLLLSACGGDDEGVPGADLPTLLVEGMEIQEGDETSELEITVRLEGTNLTNVLVNYAAVSGTAIAESDFSIQGSSKLQFAPDETTKTIIIEILGDKDIEPDETFDLLLYNPINAVLDNGRVEIKILNDDIEVNPLEPPSEGYTTPDSYTGYDLVWADEFNGSGLSQGNWNYEIGTGNGGWGNNELQYYRAENTSVGDGLLIIEARKENFGGSQYTSSRLTTQGKQSFQYGRIDIRAALPIGQGYWPALWMLGNNFNTVSWPVCGEIDIMELIGNQPNRVYGTVHYGDVVNQDNSSGATKLLPGDETFDQEFHVFSLIWEENLIEWYVDDELYFTFTSSDVGGFNYPFNQEFFFIFNVAVGGSFPGSPDASTSFPRRMFVDYVRVFQPQ